MAAPTKSLPEQQSSKPPGLRPIILVGVLVVPLAVGLFLVRTEFKRVHDLPVAIPPQKSSEASPTWTIVVVDGTSYSINGKTMAIEDVKKILEDARPSSAQSVLIVSPPDKNFDAAIRLLDLVRAVGLQNVAVETRVPDPAKR